MIHKCIALQPHETGLQFCNRVKSLIANQGGLVDLEWCVSFLCHKKNNNVEDSFI